MPARPAADGFETGIVTRDGDRLLRFYAEVLGFEPVSTLPIPGICVIHRLRFGSSFLRLVVPEAAPVHDHAGGPFMESTGFRYLLVEVENLHETLAEAEAMGCAVPVPPREIRPGRTICQIQDPDGNHVELAQATPVSG